MKEASEHHTTSLPSHELGSLADAAAAEPHALQHSEHTPANFATTEQQAVLPAPAADNPAVPQLTASAAEHAPITFPEADLGQSMMGGLSDCHPTACNAAGTQQPPGHQHPASTPTIGNPYPEQPGCRNGNVNHQHLPHQWADQLAHGDNEFDNDASAGHVDHADHDKQEQSYNSEDDHDPDMSAAVSILGKRKRMQNALSLENLKHRKTCPACGKVHGNAKKGQCGNTLLDGTTCNYTFVVQQRGRSKVQPPPNESMPTDQRPLKKVHDQFVKLINEAAQFAAKTGLSVGVVATGAVHTNQRPTELKPVVDAEVFIKNLRLPGDGSGKCRVVALKYGTGGAAKLLMDKYDVLDFITSKATMHLAGDTMAQVSALLSCGVNYGAV
eukprot:jgi/Chrzof1/12642/Cz07g02030.t1